MVCWGYLSLAVTVSLSSLTGPHWVPVLLLQRLGQTFFLGAYDNTYAEIFRLYNSRLLTSQQTTASSTTHYKTSNCYFFQFECRIISHSLYIILFLSNSAHFLISVYLFFRKKNSMNSRGIYICIFILCIVKFYQNHCYIIYFVITLPW